MSLPELLPAIRALSRSEKVQLAKILKQGLEEEELLSMFKPGQVFEICTPLECYGAAAQLARFLEEEGKQS